MTMLRNLIVLASFAACGSHGAPPSHPDAAGDDAAVDAPPAIPEIELMYRSRDGSAVPCAPDAPVPLVLPPQGGFVMLVGLRAKHVDLSSVMITASIRDTVTDQVLSLEQRPVTLTVGADGWAVPDMPSSLSNWSNLPACPLASATRDTFDQPYLLRIAVQDATGAQADAKLTIVPSCDAGSAGDTCRCECKRGYMLGDPCP